MSDEVTANLARLNPIIPIQPRISTGVGESSGSHPFAFKPSFAGSPALLPVHACWALGLRVWDSEFSAWGLGSSPLGLKSFLVLVGFGFQVKSLGGRSLKRGSSASDLGLRVLDKVCSFRV